jgi:hypothetical protein
MSTPASDPLGRAHAQLRKAVYPARKQARAEMGHLAHLGAATFEILDRMKANGENFEARCAYLEGILRQILCHGRAWKYLCQQCDDRGLMLSDCPGNDTCGRSKPHLAHTFGRPCHCAKGRQFEKPRDAFPEDYTQAGKTHKPKSRGFAPVGR